MRWILFQFGLVLGTLGGIAAASGASGWSGLPGAEVRYRSAEVLYLEGLENGSWVGKYWTPDGRLNTPDERKPYGAFFVEIDRQAVTNGWTMGQPAELPGASHGSRHIAVPLTNQAHALEVTVHTLLDGTPVLTRWLELRNASGRSVALTACFPWCARLWPRPPTDFDLPLTFSLGYFTNQNWSAEGWFNWVPLPVGTRSIISDQARSHDDPFFVVRNDAIGEYFIGELAWTANWKMEFIREERSLFCRVGPASAAALRVLAPGETLSTPAVHLGYVSGDLDRTVQAMHDHLRRAVLPTRTPDQFGLIQFVVPADQGFAMPFSETSALNCVEVAAAVGAELFILDFGWWDITCDWTPSPSRFPRGLQPLIDRVHRKGMKFGLYLETEGGRGNVLESRVAHEHPDWFGPAATLRLENPAAAAWMESEIRRLISEYHVDLYRLDYNPSFQFDTTVRDGIVENNCWRYYDAFYGVYERIRAAYPRVILQQAAAGGARNDLGTASRFHEQYLSDGLNMPREFLVYSGQTLALPPEVFVILHGADGRGGAGKPHHLDTVLRLSFALGTPQIFVALTAPNLKELDAARRERFQHYARLYRQFIRPLWPTARMFHHEPVNAHGGVTSSGWFAVEFASPDRKRGWAMVARTGTKEADAYCLRPRGLDPARNYAVTLDSLDTTCTISGLSLMRDGLPIRGENVGSSELVLFRAK